MEEFHGWPNRETWCVALWLSNDPGWNEWLEELRARASRGDDWHTEAADHLEGAMADWQASIADGDLDDVPDYARKMILDTGSLYRVDWWRIVEPD